ncbi:hypothetical protein LCGC14_2106480 [marine sediment metagenome]|uniref:Ice-binding protein C-terminal domain-containing protein n=1 Tax=marine sediment metagenome TaxID=412755 RepID=A0A0F9E8M3_9ZZZZ
MARREKLCSKKGPRVKIFITIVVTTVVLLGALGGVGAWYRARQAKTKDNSTKVRVAHPVRGELVEVVSAPGEVEPRTKVSISARLSARIEALPFKEGDRVTKGDPNANPPVAASVLVQLDASDAAGAVITSFRLVNAPDPPDFNAPGIANFPFGVLKVDTPGEIGDLDLQREGFAGIWNLGDIFPVGMTQAELEEFVTIAKYTGAVGTSVLDLDLIVAVVPEPGTLAMLLGAGLLGLLMLTIRRMK